MLPREYNIFQGDFYCEFRAKKSGFQVTLSSTRSITTVILQYHLLWAHENYRINMNNHTISSRLSLQKEFIDQYLPIATVIIQYPCPVSCRFLSLTSAGEAPLQASSRGCSERSYSNQIFSDIVVRAKHRKCLVSTRVGISGVMVRY